MLTNIHYKCFIQFANCSKVSRCYNDTVMQRVVGVYHSFMERSLILSIHVGFFQSTLASSNPNKHDLY